MTSKKLVLSTEYTKKQDSHGYEWEDPIVDLEIIAKGIAHPIHAYADTGTDQLLSISMKFAKDIGLERHSDEIHEITLADGSQKGAYLYEATLKFGDITSDVLIPVIDPTVKLPRSRTRSTIEPLLGRELMDKYNVSFLGKSTPKRLVFEE